MIKVNNLSFAYGKKEILKDISLSINAGEITTILGENGCGKSTLLNLLSKHLKYKSGNIIVNGKEIKEIPFRHFSRMAALVSQHNTAPDSLTVRELVAYGRIPYAHTKEHYKNTHYIDKALEETGLTQLQDQLVSSLSGGQMQRVWIAMAIAQNTKLLFLDEPTTFLDMKHQVEVLRLVKELNQKNGLTVVMILHDINQAIHFSDKVIALKDGNVYFAGKPQEFVTSKHVKEVYGMELTMIQKEEETFVVGI